MRGRGRDRFATVRVDGRILPPDLLGRVSENDPGLGGLRREDYHLSGETISEATSRSWNRLLGAWTAFKERRQNLLEAEPETSMTRERWLLPLFRELDYGRLQTSSAVGIGGKTYPVSHAWESTPIHLVGFRAELDTRTSGRAGAARMSPHSLVQELLNRSDDHLWAFVSNGLRLRILRDNASITRQSYVEFDLEAMMEGEVYPDFVLLWMLCHQSRVETGESRREECWLEKWSQAAQEQGSRALDRLRIGVETAIRTLGSGFLTHPGNADLRQKLRDGELHVQDYYRQLLRLVYRMLFLFVAEDRDHLLDPDASPEARDRYTRFYGTRKLRLHAEKRVGGRHPDLYRQLAFVIKVLGDDEGCPPLGLPALGGFLFDEGAAPDLAAAEISNRDLLDAVRALAFVDAGAGLTGVDFEHLGAEELGSVYESLLELAPVLEADSGEFKLETVGGNERKTTGSYYTPDSLVASLLDTALDPVLEEATKKPDAESAILALKVCDPAVGSGHFLIRAAHRIARRLAAVRTGDDEPAPTPYREALRDVIGRCLYGVDVNPMSAELCRFNLLLEGLAPGKPLSFLDHHVKVGNSLIGVDSDLLSEGVISSAFDSVKGDDKKRASAAKKRNAEERHGQDALAYDWETQMVRDVAAVQGIEILANSDPKRAQRNYEDWERSEEHAQRIRVANLLTSAYFWPLSAETPDPPTHGYVRRVEEGSESFEGRRKYELERLTKEYRFFHWELQFPEIFKAGRRGFDCIIGNPPWDLVQADSFGGGDVALEKLKAWFKKGRYSILKGRRDLYKLFVILARDLVHEDGRAAFLVPFGMFAEDDSVDARRELYLNGSVIRLQHFQNGKESFFPNVDSRTRFVALTYSPSDAYDHEFSTVVRSPFEISGSSWLRVERSRLTHELGESVAAALFPDEKYAEIHEDLMRKLRRTPQLQFDVVAEFHATSDRKLTFDEPRDDSDWRTLKNASIHQFNHQFAEAGRYVSQTVVAERCLQKGLDPTLWVDELSHRLLFRDIARNDDTRTLLCCLAPYGYVSSYDTPMIVPREVTTLDELGQTLNYVCALLNSFTFDFLVRPFVDKHIKSYVLRRLPIPAFDPANPSMLYLSALTSQMSRERASGRSKDEDGSERSMRATAVLEATVAHLMDVTASQLQDLLDTFLSVKRTEERKYGEYRTSRVILEIYDEIACAAASGQPYRTPLDPPPVDLGTVEAAPATVTLRRPRQTQRPEEARPAALAAEERHRYETEQKEQTPDPDRRQSEALVETILDGADFSELPPGHWGDAAERPPAEKQAPADHQQTRLSNGNEDAALDRPTTPKAPSSYDAALALHACLPDGQKVRKHELLADAARELGYPKLARQVKTALNKALNTEHNAGRLKTDWALVWKPKK